MCSVYKYVHLGVSEYVVLCICVCFCVYATIYMDSYLISYFALMALTQMYDLFLYPL